MVPVDNSGNQCPWLTFLTALSVFNLELGNLDKEEVSSLCWNSEEVKSLTLRDEELETQKHKDKKEVSSIY